jgi:hypothetical protein
MTESRLQRIEKLFEDVESFEDLSRKLERGEERELLKRISLLRFFNEKIFNEYLKRYLPLTPDFTTFVTNINVEPVPRTQKIYAIRDEARQHYLDALVTDKNSNAESWNNAKEIFNDLLKFFQNEPTFQLDQLVLLIILNPVEAKKQFETLYAEADARFDLSRCNDVLRTLEIRLSILPAELKDSWEKLRQYYNARQLYVSDYYQTTTYYSRDITSLNLDIFFHDAAPDAKQWIFQVYATGGLGKTMFVRWLISRYCLPEPNRIPVARLDFDLLNLSYLSLHPLLLLLPILEQLDNQIERRPFREKFSWMQSFKPLLEPMSEGVDRTSLEMSFQTIEPIWNQTAMLEFQLALQDIQFTGPIVIVIDTLEEMLLLNRDGLANVIKQVQEMHTAYKSVRLVLSGRYDLRKELSDLENLLETEAITHELHRFTTTEARHYVIEKRGLTDSQCVEAIVAKCADKQQEINPFILSLMTDLVTSRDIKTVEEIAKYPRAEVAYMIQRIIERIKDFDIRWMLRYAVVPRVLTLEVLQGFLWAHLVEEREQRRGKDLSSGAHKGLDQTKYWSYGSASTAAEAWEKLRPFVTSYGWISFDNQDPGQLRLHSEVVVPMRYLLAKEEIFPLLHRDAMRYFAQRAENEKSKPEVWLSEALYHRFQFEGPRAVSYWRQQLDKTEFLQSDMDARKRFATEITKRDYVDEEGVPIKWPDEQSKTDIVSLKDLCEAHQEAAAASIMLAARYKQTTSRYISEWTQAREHLLKLQALMKSPEKPNFRPNFELEQYLQLAEQLKETAINYNTTIPLLESALENTRSIFLSLALRIQVAEMHSTIASPQAAYHFREALSAGGFLRIPFLSPLRIRLKLARSYQDQKHFREALAEYTTALHDTRHGSRAFRNIQSAIARIYVEIGQPSTAATLTQELLDSGKPGSNDDFENQILFSQITARDLYRPRVALASVRSLMEFATDPKGYAAVTELEGLILGQLMEFKDAAVLLERAKEQWGSLSDETGPDRTRMYRLDLQMDQVGDFKEITTLLEAWQNYGNRRDADIESQMDVLWMRYAVLQGNRDLAGPLWQGALNTKQPPSVARILSAALALGLGDEKTLPQLIDVLGEIEPSSARLPLLAAFRFAKQDVIDDGPMKATRLLKLIEWPVEKREAFSSIVLFADVLRFCRLNERLDELLGQAINRALQQNELFACVQLLSVLNRTPTYKPEPPDLKSTPFLDEYREFPGLCYAALLEQAERELNKNATSQAQISLKKAMEYLRPDSVSKWDAFAAQLNARLQVQLGEQKKATVHLNNAGSIYQALGDYYAVEQLNKQQATVEMETQPVEFSRLEKTWTLRCGFFATNFVLNLSGPDDLHIVQTIKAPDYLQEAFASVRERTEILRFISRMSESPEPFRRELATALFGTNLASYFRYPKSQLPLRLDLSPHMAKVPWEWIIADESLELESVFRYVYRCSSTDGYDTEAIKWIQLALRALTNHDIKIDGFFGPEAQKQLNALGFEKDRPLSEVADGLAKRLQGLYSPRIKALIVKPSHDTQVWSSRGFGGSSPLSLYEIFDARVLEVSRAEKLVDELEKAIRRFQPQLIHIESSYTENPQTADIYLDFNVRPESIPGGGGSGSLEMRGADYVQISTTLLSDLLDSLPASSLRPLVILEAQNAAGLSSTIHQMLLRNTFASELFRHGKTCGVIATGLFEERDYRKVLLEQLTYRLDGRYSLGAAVNEMIYDKNRFPHERHGFLSWPVLFTNSPWITLIPPEPKPGADLA